ncbi:hypothetical protein GGI18_000022 [Coemansia linderi]|uniref:Uncharacterized protein n=1 Tax=Coemansia linderi TaxID=2663919 RepID=A0ACC1KQK4_9FUNG|nr:hypothetical protein GGI18_000022 [Coemansia linderi]
MPRLVLQTSNPVVDLQQYRAKCNELEELASRFRAKCLDYDRLSSRYDQLRSGLNEQRMQQLKKTSSAAALARKPGTPLTNRDPFIELNAPEQTTKGIPARHGPKRTSPTEQVSPDNARVGSGAVEGTTPTKRPRHSTLTTSLPGILSSPLTSHKPHFPLNPRKRSSQETRLDFSDPPYMPEDEGVLLCLGTHPEEGESEHRDEDAADDSAWQLMLQTPTRPERQYPEFPRDSSDSDSGGRKSESGSVCAQPSPDLQRILDAVGDCELCRSFYSVPGLVLPKRDPTTLCQHASGSRKSRGKAAADWGARNACNDGAMPHEGMAAPPLRHYRDATMSAPRPERSSTSSCQPGPVRQPPKSEQRRPTTPDHFWDIDYFPPINALGVDTFRRNKHQNSDSS